jgi:hypothetical protein
MGRWVIAVVAAGVALVAASARAETAQVVLAPTVYASHELPSNAIRTFAVSCPRGYAAVAAGVSNPAPGATLLKVTPVGFGAYTFRFGNPATSGAARVTVAVTCRKVRVGPLLKLKPVKLTFSVRPGTQKSASLPCPAQTTPAGGGIDLAPTSAKSATAFGGAPLELRASTATLRGFRLTVRNTGKRVRAAAAYGNCLTVVRAAGARSAPLRVKITTFTDPVPPGRKRIAHACPRGWFSLGAGYAARPRSVHVTGAAAVTGGGRWWIENNGDVDAKANVQLTCGTL